MCPWWEFLHPIPRIALGEGEFPLPLARGALSLPHIQQKTRVIKMKENSSLFIYLFNFYFPSLALLGAVTP